MLGVVKSSRRRLLLRLVARTLQWDNSDPLLGSTRVLLPLESLLFFRGNVTFVAGHDVASGELGTFGGITQSRVRGLPMLSIGSLESVLSFWSKVTPSTIATFGSAS